MRLLITGGSGVLGRALRPLAEGEGHEFEMPRHQELDLFDPSAVADAVRALLSALSLPSGIYNVCRDGERVSAERFTQAAGWHPEQ
jgi:dTDP-4-dehydrorhamnose reductase